VKKVKDMNPKSILGGFSCKGKCKIIREVFEDSHVSAFDRLPRKRKKLEAFCVQCGNVFRVFPSEVGKRKFCSKKCLYEARKRFPPRVMKAPNSKIITRLVVVENWRELYRYCKTCGEYIPKTFLSDSRCPCCNHLVHGVVAIDKRYFNMPVIEIV